MSTERFCRDCAHRRGETPEFWKCAHTARVDDAQDQYRVTGVMPEPEMDFCVVVRKYKECGANALWFTPREERAVEPIPMQGAE